jgi:hypothetical protein
MSAIGVLPGQIVQASHYQDYMILYTEGEAVECVVDGAPPGPNGRLFIVEPGKPVKVPWEAGRFILEHLAYTGVVRVNEVDKEDGTGTVYDIPAARAQSLVLFEHEDGRRWRDYVEYCIMDKMNNKKAVPATPDTIKRLMARRNYRLSDYGIAPVGEIQPMDTGIADLKAENTALRTQLADMSTKLNRLMSLLGEDEEKKVKR